MELIFNEYCESIIKDRLQKMRQYVQLSENTYRISKLLILMDFVLHIQYKLAKIGTVNVRYNETFTIDDYEKAFKIPFNGGYSKKPYHILYRNHKLLADMISMLKFTQRKPFLRLHNYMQHCREYVVKYQKVNWQLFSTTFRRAIRTITAYSSVIKNTDIVLVIRFTAFLLGLTEQSKITSWEELYQYCANDCFGLVTIADESYQNLLCEVEDHSAVSSYPEESIATFNQFVAFMDSITSSQIFLHSLE